MNKYAFRNLMFNLEHRVNKEGKKNPSWFMGYLQGLGTGTLTGFQCAALVDLLLVPLEKELAVSVKPVPEKREDLPEKEEEAESEAEAEPVPEVRQSSRMPGNFFKTLAQR